MKDELFNRRQFIFGETLAMSGPLSSEEAERMILKGEALKKGLHLPSQKDVLAVFSRLQKSWSNPLYTKRVEAFEVLRKDASLSEAFIKAVLDEFPNLVSPERLLRKIEAEFGSQLIQDELIRQPSSNLGLTVRPAGLILHVAAGNVFLGCVESLIDGVITKNINFLKMSAADRNFPVIFAESVKECDSERVIYPRLATVWWRAGDESVEGIFKKRMDRIIFWGGVEALLSWQRNLGPSTILVQHGHKISFGVISNKGLEGAAISDLAGRIAFDVAVWEQRGCNSPQMLFIEEGVPSQRLDLFINALEESFKNMNERLPAAERSCDEYVEALKTRELAIAKHIARDIPVDIRGPKTLDWTIISHGRSVDEELGPSPLNRTLVIKRYSSPKALPKIALEHMQYLQTVGYCLADYEVPEYAKLLATLGVTRMCRFGSMAIPAAGGPHDGTYTLRDLARFTVVE